MGGGKFGPCFIVHYLVWFLFLQLSRCGSENWLLYFNCLLIPFDFQCLVSLPRGTMGWSAVCVCVAFPGHTYFLCDFAQFNFKIPHCNYHQQDSAVS